jgi:23S rRNA (cytosine1962-C5)-methyltransferase
MNSFPRVRVTRGAEKRVRAGHPWIFRSQIAKGADSCQNGDLVDVYSFRGTFLGRGYFNRESQITIRLLSRKPVPIDEDFFRRRLKAAFRRRQVQISNTTGIRLVHAEADFLPGLIVDRYDDFLVLQILTLGMETFRHILIPLLVELFSPKGIYERSDVKQRTYEGLEEKKGVVWGQVPDSLPFVENGMSFWANVADGQKTGFFLDQRDNRLLVKTLSQGRRVLDCFCYNGGFSVAAAVGGARSVTGVDISQSATEAAKRNAEANRVAERISFLNANCFDLLKQYDRQGEQFDLIVLDPPAFAKNKQALEGALRGYKEINLRALKLLAPSGLLLTASCSHSLSEAQFQQVLAEAAADVHRHVWVRSKGFQPADHPILLNVPETAYLKSFLLQFAGD